MPQKKILKDAFIDGAFIKAGSVIDYDGPDAKWIVDLDAPNEEPNKNSPFPPAIPEKPEAKAANKPTTETK